MVRDATPESKEKAWAMLHAETEAEMETLRISDSVSQGVTPDLIEEMRQAREQMGKPREE